ncbi:MAG: hypothetical protein JWN48_6031 [Myxococcaceae bacterium]|nr:hypothetical protein [Myxococcaceae bacterium]
MLDFEKLDAYRCALEFAALAFRIIEALPRGQSELAEQLRRAMLSIPLNIAEGSGKTTQGERRRYHSIARGSAMECAAIIDVLRIQSLVDIEAARQAKTLAVRLVSMLSVMSRR